MNAIAGHLVRRGLDIHHSTKADPEVDIHLEGWQIATLVVTAIAFMAILSMIDYTYGHLVPTLAMVESATAVLSSDELPPAYKDVIGAKIPVEKEVFPANVTLEEEVFPVKHAPITSSFRKTIRHLRTRAGRLSRFRGLSLFILYAMVNHRLTNLLAIFLPMGFDHVLSAVILARSSMGWTHIVITESSSKYWWSRIPNFQAWKKIAGPVAIATFLNQCAIYLPVFFLRVLNVDITNPKDVPHGCGHAVLALQLAATALLTLAFTITLVIPANVALTLVQASLLPEEETTIVPFDRTFGDSITPGETIRMMDAWKTFDWSARVRLIKVYVKTAAMEAAVSLLFFGTILFQLHYFLGNDLQKVVSRWGREHGDGQQDMDRGNF